MMLLLYPIQISLFWTSLQNIEETHLELVHLSLILDCIAWTLNNQTFTNCQNQTILNHVLASLE